jgi:tetratricopeptide (TPR) repeat protein
MASTDCPQCGGALPTGGARCATCGARPEALAPDDGAHRLLAEANLARLRSHFDEAIALCTRVLRGDPANAGAHALMGDIYADQANHREALGWYKLAVQLNPHNPADRKKLDAAIDHVFHGVRTSDVEAISGFVTEDAPATPSDGGPGVGALLRRIILKLQPAHVALGAAGLMMLGVVVVLAINALGPRLPKTSPIAVPGDSPGVTTPVVSPTAPGASGDPKAADPQIVPPRPDLVEIGGARTPKITAPPDDRRPVTRDPGTGMAPPVPTVDPGGPKKKPYKIEADPEDAAHARTLHDSLQAVLDGSKLPGATLRAVKVEADKDDPARTSIAVEFLVPPMNTPRDTKQGLLYAGFELVWAAQRHERNAAAFSLRGFARLTPDAEPVLAFLADINAAQATKARAAKNYATAIQYLDYPWWHRDIADAPVE